MCREAFKLVVAGSRNFTNYRDAEAILLSVLKNRNLKEVCIVSGGAKGADRIGEIFANKHGCMLEVYPADWQRFGKRAGHIRNDRMASVSDATILFWDGISSGTQNMYWRTHERNHPLFVVYFDPNTLQIKECRDESNPF